MTTVEAEKIGVEDGILRINEYETEEQDVVSFFENLQEQGKNLEEMLEDVLKLGVIVSKSGTVKAGFATLSNSIAFVSLSISFSNSVALCTSK